MITQNETLILGIGNTLLSDEGAGIHALNLIQSEYADIPKITFLDGGTLSFTLASWIEDCDSLIVFDAAELQMPAGSVKTFAGAGMDAFLGAAKRSAHEVGLMDLMDIARITGHLPVNRALIGIQPDYMDWGMEPTRAVQNALPTAVEQAVMLIEGWNNEKLIKHTESQKFCNNTLAESSDTGA
ncbi:MAG: HyaD/HybD family hydrogenase maturation endopeptidase [Gammaproteobacteria bacterium]|jgi:hydrogenase maturation protease